MDLSAVRVDLTRSKAGEWVKNIPGLGDIELKIKGSNTPAFRLGRIRAQKAIPAGARLEDGLIDPEEADKSNGLVLADLLVDWKNVNDGDAEVPFSREAAVRFLTDPELPVFRDGVAYAADEVATLRKAKEDESLGK